MANEIVLSRSFFGHESITVSTTAIGFTAATITPSTAAAPVPPAAFALATVETDQIRWTADGTTPTSTVGHLANAGDVIELHGYENVRNFRAIRVTTDATLKASFAR